MVFLCKHLALKYCRTELGSKFEMADAVIRVVLPHLQGSLASGELVSAQWKAWIYDSDHVVYELRRVIIALHPDRKSLQLDAVIRKNKSAWDAFFEKMIVPHRLYNSSKSCQALGIPESIYTHTEWEAKKKT
eukprot:3766618-Amphidinium_carterae.3